MGEIVLWAHTLGYRTGRWLIVVPLTARRSLLPKSFSAIGKERQSPLLLLSPFESCRPSRSTSRTSGTDSAATTVRTVLHAHRASDELAATDEFDKLCFDFGIELDEDVRCIPRTCATIAQRRTDYGRGRKENQAGAARRETCMHWTSRYMPHLTRHLPQQLKIEIPANRCVQSFSLSPCALKLRSAQVRFALHRGHRALSACLPRQRKGAVISTQVPNRRRRQTIDAQNLQGCMSQRV